MIGLTIGHRQKVYGSVTSGVTVGSIVLAVAQMSGVGFTQQIEPTFGTGAMTLAVAQMTGVAVFLDNYPLIDPQETTIEFY
jgi:hypothetical protein